MQAFSEALCARDRCLNKPEDLVALMQELYESHCLACCIPRNKYGRDGAGNRHRPEMADWLTLRSLPKRPRTPTEDATSSDSGSLDSPKSDYSTPPLSDVQLQDLAAVIPAEALERLLALEREHAAALAQRLSDAESAVSEDDAAPDTMELARALAADAVDAALADLRDDDVANDEQPQHHVPGGEVAPHPDLQDEEVAGCDVRLVASTIAREAIDQALSELNRSELTLLATTPAEQLPQSFSPPLLLRPMPVKPWAAATGRVSFERAADDARPTPPPRQRRQREAGGGAGAPPAGPKPTPTSPRAAGTTGGVSVSSASSSPRDHHPGAARGEGAARSSLPPSAEKAHADDDPLRAFLHRHRLSEFGEGLAGLGATTLEDLADVQMHDLQAMEMPILAQRRFHRAVAPLHFKRHAQESATGPTA